jgi:hypothetical protein
MSKILEYFDALVSHGLQVIPIKANAKSPLCKGWNSKSWDSEKTRNKLLHFPDSNIGVLLGNIIDVEGDSPSANELLNKIIGKYPHPCYSSARSIHHLFLNPDPGLSIFEFQKIEFRGHGHQSVLPPSKHNDVCYSWLNCAQFPIPEMPKRLLDFYHKVKYGNLNNLKPNHIKVYCSVCQRSLFLHKKRWQLELRLFQSFGMKWQCRKCRSVVGK